MMARRLSTLMTIFVFFLLLLAACGGAGDEAPAEEEAAAEDSAAEESADAPADGDLAGTTVTIFGAAVDEQAELVNEAFEPLEERTGIEVEYEGSSDFETLVVVRAEANDPPDIAVFPQPGLMAELAQGGFLVDLTTFIDRSYLEEQFDDSWLELATVNDEMVGVWHNADVKSLVWYPTPEFEEAGYEIPETWDEMIALSDQMVAEGQIPWCIGMESSGATGWVATDWVEDIMLRTTSPENYDRWVAGELPFDSPEVKRAVQIMGDIWLNEEYVLGGTTGILTTPFGDAPTPLFDQPPTCWLHRQASFITLFFPEDVELGTDVNYFYLPPIDEAYGKPVLGSGSIYSMFDDRPEVREVMRYLTTAESTRVEVEAGTIVAPHNDANLEWYPSDIQRGYAEILQEADTFRFDASDLMPSSVGAGSFWTGMVDYVNGEDVDEVLPRIDATWPEEEAAE